MVLESRNWDSRKINRNSALTLHSIDVKSQLLIGSGFPDRIGIRIWISCCNLDYIAISNDSADSSQFFHNIRFKLQRSRELTTIRLNTSSKYAPKILFGIGIRALCWPGHDIHNFLLKSLPCNVHCVNTCVVLLEFPLSTVYFSCKREQLRFQNTYIALRILLPDWKLEFAYLQFIKLTSYHDASTSILAARKPNWFFPRSCQYESKPSRPSKLFFSHLRTLIAPNSIATRHEDDVLIPNDLAFLIRSVTQRALTS